MQYENDANGIKFLTINTASLWRLGSGEEISGKESNLEYSENGISLRAFKTYALTRKFSIDLTNVEYLAFDRCNILYIIYEPDKQNNNKILLRYAGLGTQILVSLGLAVFIGLKLDTWIRTPFPVLVWLLPLLVIIGMIIKTIKDTSKKHDK